MSDNKMSILMDFKGASREVTLLSGMKVTIREQNGDDDDIISKMKDARTGENISKFLSAIIISINGVEKKIPYTDIEKWKVSDKYYLMLNSRILSIGEELKFEHKCPNTKCNKKTRYEENLMAYIIPNEHSKPEDKKLFDENIWAPKLYPKTMDEEREFTTRSGKKIKYTYLTSLGEKYLTSLDPEQTTTNVNYTKRDLKLYHNGEWLTISHFAIFSSKDMFDIRVDVKDNDPQFEAISEVICPNPDCQHKTALSLVAVTDFFYPVLL